MNIFICGDSTAQTYDPAQTLMVGWGQLLGDFLPGVTVCNHAKAGRSTKSFLAEGRLQALDGQIKPGDLVLIQFAHNDENEKPERHTEPWTSYTDNLTAFIRFARERGAVPALLTPICMRVWENGALQETHGEYKDAMRSLAIKMDVPLLDIYRDSYRLVAEAGEEGSKAFFMHVALGEDPRYPEGLSDNAHTRRAGAERFAACVAKQLIGAGLVSPQ
ncbi:MAG: rhamnogalacturonan acetylesterase [Clostridia bacterium]|nr:rhamnogalacturonan acetylesterase [Clostridia bacterium]